MKFSIVIPVYNVEKYIDKCLDSVVKQTYDNYEVIIVNDGSPDNSQKIIDKYVNKDKRFRSYIKENGGLSDARNYGVKKATGDYLIFIDSDDYVDEQYLSKINSVLSCEENVDVIKIKIILVDENGIKIREEKGFDFNDYVDFADLVKLEFIEPAWSYVYSLKFWNENKFKYAKERLHEDFGLTPEILVKADRIYYLNTYCYFYVQRPNSIMSANDSKKIKKKAYDMLYQYDRLMTVDVYDQRKDRIFKSFLSNAIISKTNTLNDTDKKEYMKEITKRHAVDYLLTDSIKRKIKKLMLKIKFRSW